MSRGLVALLALCAASAAAQEGDKELPRLPAPTLEAYRAEGRIDPPVWASLQLPASDGIQAKHEKLPKTLELGFRAIPANAPDRPVIGNVEMQLLPLGAGFLLHRTKVGGEQTSTDSTELTWLGIIVLNSHRATGIQFRGTMTGTTDVATAAVSSIEKWGSTDLKLDQMKPGYRWQLEYASGVETSSKASLVSRRNKVSVTRKQVCDVGEGGQAANLGPGLSGSFLKVACASQSDPNVSIEYAYLEDYGYFLQVRSRNARANTEYKLTSAK